MSRMSDIHAAASEIDTTDADAVQHLADALAAEHYAADIAIAADEIARDYAGLIPEDETRTLADNVASFWYAPKVAEYADAVRRVIESSSDDCPICECRPGAVCDHWCHA